MARQIIRLTESDLHRIIKESVKRILREEDEPEYTMEDLEAAKQRMQALRQGKKVLTLKKLAQRRLGE